MISTPIYKINSTTDQANIYIKREDLMPFSFGGNKVRIAEEFLNDMKKKGKDCMIGYGNARSNLSRVLSNLCYRENIPCYIISPNDDDGTCVDTANSRIVNLCGAEVVTCEKKEVAEVVLSVMQKCVDNGYCPYYIYGNELGIGNRETPVLAYIKAYNEIVQWSHDNGIWFDYIFHASGTGMTQSGLIAGKILNNGKEKIVGISVARRTENEEKVIQQYLDDYFSSGKTKDFKDNIIVVDDYLSGGYGKYDISIKSVIKEQIKLNGIPLDPIYTGKAFYGMQQYIKKNNVSGNILFIHTGGTPLLFDDISILI